MYRENSISSAVMPVQAVGRKRQTASWKRKRRRDT